MFKYSIQKLFTAVIVIIISSYLFASGDVTEAKFKVEGICGMCKERIEKSLKIKEVKFARWDKKTKELKVAFLSEKITADSLMKRVASTGHDNEKFKATDEVYNTLHKCCLYREQSSH
jgi:periplasmic mercuric ion binding protein